MGVLGRVAITGTMHCRACGANIAVTLPPAEWDGQAVTVATLSGSEQTFLRLFAAGHRGPFLVTVEV